jgi:hypothetical protein
MSERDSVKAVPTETRSTGQPHEPWAGCERLARSPNILEEFAATLRSQGVVGEERAAKLLYLVLTTRFLDRPVSAVVKGPSSGGKSHLVESVLKFFPGGSNRTYRKLFASLTFERRPD